MNRLPFVVTLAAVVALTASVAYWSLQLFKPQQRPIAGVAVQETPPAPLDAARGLFGGESAVAAVSTYQLRGVVATRDGRGSVAIIASNGETPKAYPVGTEVAAGVTVRNVQPRYVTLVEGGVPKRLDLPADSGISSTTAAPLPPATRGAPPQPQSTMPAQMPGIQAGQYPSASPPPAPSATPMVAPPPGTPIGPPGQLAPIQSAPAQRTATSQ